MPQESKEDASFLHFESSESGSRLARLWRQFHLRGEAPRDNTQAAERLLAVCKEYVKYYADPYLLKMSSAEEERRRLHNEIALMTLGVARDDLDIEARERIGDFASYLAIGCSRDEAAGIYNKPSQRAA